MSRSHCADSVGIRILELMCIVGFEGANDAKASEQSIFSENHDYKSFRVAVNTYVLYLPLFREDTNIIIINYIHGTTI